MARIQRVIIYLLFIAPAFFSNFAFALADDYAPYAHFGYSSSTIIHNTAQSSCNAHAASFAADGLAIHSGASCDHYDVPNRYDWILFPNGQGTGNLLISQFDLMVRYICNVGDTPIDASTCRPAPPPCPNLNGEITQKLICSAWHECRSGCRYDVQNVVLTPIFDVPGLRWYTSGSGKFYNSSGSCSINTSICDLANNSNPAPPLTAELTPLTAEEKAAYDKIAADAAAAKAAADKAALDSSLASLKAAEDSQAAADKLAAQAAASQAAADKSNADALAVKSAAQAAADNQKAVDAVQKSALDAANPAATQAEKDASAAAAVAALAKAGESAVISGGAQSAAAVKSGAAAALAVPDKPKETKDFCELHPTSYICKTASATNGVCNSGTVVGFQCDGDAVQCAIARQIRDSRCADVKTDSTTELGQSVMDGTAALGGTDTFSSPREVAIGQLSSASFLPKGCLPDMSFSLGGRTIVLPLSKLCEGLQTAGKIVLAFAYMIAARIIFS